MGFCRDEFAGLNLETLIRFLSHGLIVYGIFSMILLTIFKLQPSYGRFYKTSSLSGLGINPKVAWVIQECPAFFVPFVCLISNLRCKLLYVNYTLLLLFLIHYFQRSFIFPLLINGGKPTSFFVLVSAFIFCTYNGFLQGYYLSCIAVYPKSYFSDPCFIIGTTTFVIGLIINIQSDSILRNLRKPGETGYKIPKGGLFEYVTSANFLAEIVEWWGFALATWSYPALAFAIFTTLFLSSKAYLTHKYAG